jgi:hypothetical protein
VNDGPCGVSGLNRCLHDEYVRTKEIGFDPARLAAEDVRRE